VLLEGLVEESVVPVERGERKPHIKVREDSTEVFRVDQPRLRCVDFLQLHRVVPSEETPAEGSYFTLPGQDVFIGVDFGKLELKGLPIPIVALKASPKGSFQASGRNSGLEFEPFVPSPVVHIKQFPPDGVDRGIDGRGVLDCFVGIRIGLWFYCCSHSDEFLYVQLFRVLVGCINEVIVSLLG